VARNVSELPGGRRMPLAQDVPSDALVARKRLGRFGRGNRRAGPKNKSESGFLGSET
jgi:hypothetical protein